MKLRKTSFTFGINDGERVCIRTSDYSIKIRKNKEFSGRYLVEERKILNTYVKRCCIVYVYKVVVRIRSRRYNVCRDSASNVFFPPSLSSVLIQLALFPARDLCMYLKTETDDWLLSKRVQNNLTLQVRKKDSKFSYDRIVTPLGPYRKRRSSKNVLINSQELYPSPFRYSHTTF